MKVALLPLALTLRLERPYVIKSLSFLLVVDVELGRKSLAAVDSLTAIES